LSAASSLFTFTFRYFIPLLVKVGDKKITQHNEGKNGRDFTEKSLTPQKPCHNKNGRK